MRRDRRKPAAYPRVIYGPYGASMTIERAEDWLPGWTAEPQKDGSLAAAPQAIPPRAWLKKKLREAGIPFPESAADAELYRRLNDGTGSDLVHVP